MNSLQTLSMKLCLTIFLNLVLGLPVAAQDLVGRTCGDCQSTPDVILCQSHEREQENVLAAERKVLLSKASFEEKSKSLEAVAALTLGHTNAITSNVAEVLVLGLRDESLAVRSVAVPLLARGQHRPTAIAVFEEAFVAAVALEKKFGVLVQEQIECEVPPKLSRAQRIVGEMSVRRMNLMSAELSFRAEHWGFNALRDNLILVAKDLPTESIAEALIDLLPELARSNQLKELVGGMAAIGSRSTVKGLVDYIVKTDKERAAQAKLLKKSRSQKPRRKRSRHIQESEWLGMERSRIEIETFQLAKQVERFGANTKEIREALSLLVQNRQLTELPKLQASRNAWKKWLKENRESLIENLDASLGK